MLDWFLLVIPKSLSETKYEFVFIPADITTTGIWAAITWRPCGWSPSPSCPSATETWCPTPTAAAASASSPGLWWDSRSMFSAPRSDYLPFWLCLTVALAGGGLHSAGGGGGRQEAGADQGRETCSQLHDGLPHLQEGSEKYQQYFNEIRPKPGKKRWPCHCILILDQNRGWCLSYHSCICFWRDLNLRISICNQRNCPMMFF